MKLLTQQDNFADIKAMLEKKIQVTLPSEMTITIFWGGKITHLSVTIPLSFASKVHLRFNSTHLGSIVEW